jgi:hypothetical protein
MEVPISRHQASNMKAHSICPAFELRFRSLFDEGRGYAFPCDAKGTVDLDSLSERTRNNYMFARSMIGRELAAPVVRTSDLH